MCRGCVSYGAFSVVLDMLKCIISAICIHTRSKLWLQLHVPFTLLRDEGACARILPFQRT
jgi:hypothetical protein